MDRSTSRSPRVVIVGAGMSGLCLAIRLKQAGFSDFLLIEHGDEVGGTWFKNTYPNCGCDIPSYLYSYSFAPNYTWSMKYARQPEILDYFKSCADRFGIREHIRFGRTVTAAAFDETTGQWTVKTDDDVETQCDVFVSAVGQLNRPHVPEIEGHEEFQGVSWHSAQWNHDYDMTDKTVAVIGNGASAIQFVPEIARKVRQLIVVQRTPSWIQSVHNYRYPSWAKWTLRTLPFCARLHRLWIFLMCEWRIVAFQDHTKLNSEYARILRRAMRRELPESDWGRLIPDYAPGCKRILLSSDFLPTLQRDNVEVISEGLQRFTRDALITESESREIDAVIFATGFKSNEFLQPMEIRGRDGRSLQSEWSVRPKAHYGMSASGFPNMFLLYGPNTNLGHNSIIFMVERQVDYIIRCLRKMRKMNANIMEVTSAAMSQSDEDVQTRLESSVWAGDCTNWYKTADGSIPNNWWGSALAYWRRIRRPDFSEFEFRTRDQ